MNTSLRQFKVFLAVAEAGNFSKAGERIGITQPAVSRAIGELEQSLGLRLLDRTTREVALTDAGRRLHSHLERVLEDLEAALLDVRGMAQLRRGRVRVGSSPTLSASLMPACIAASARSAPNVEIVLLDRIQQDVLDSVRTGDVDFGVVVDPAMAEDLHCETLFREPFCLVCPHGHPLAGRPCVAWQALDGHGLVLLDHASGSRRLIDEALVHHAVQARVVQQLGHPTTVLRMVEAGIGLAVLPALALHCTLPPSLVVRALTPQVDHRLMLVHRRHRSLSPLAAQAWQLVSVVAQTLPGIALEGSDDHPALTPGGA
ncbi:LysR family transcriptional regulator [Xylophilus ampelinus]|uniref:DNA-binding transcriptional LysR family regulator n=1 Tax=Xylophilus ampelinus TaxID=54067 RepID=A0A318SQJ5_9BURK|nr:LysR family transcriptional regulator [Xylophilus ampelinus]MCS4511502.1 LysR substrate-binding domain-containing protein [Xylophilus ampelinus]PYE74800.1 DNA-binding transcriptional LysR family regulator [Xylophilus ampelinus]